MKLSVNDYFDDEDGKYIATKYFIDGEECSENDYFDMLEELDEIEYEDDEVEEIEICGCPCCEGNNYLEVVIDKINEVMEMFESNCACDDCKFSALMELVMLGADGALQGCIGKAED